MSNKNIIGLFTTLAKWKKKCALKLTEYATSPVDTLRDILKIFKMFS